MSVKTVSDSDTGDSTHVGGADWNKLARYVNGTAAAITATIDSNTTYRDARLKFSNGASVATIRNTGISTNFDISIPTPTGTTSDTMLTAYSATSVYNKVLNAWDNTLGGTVKLPSVKKWGAIMAGGVLGGGSGTGLLYGFQDLPVTGALPTRGTDTTYGSYWRYNSTTTANTVTGIKLPARWILKEWLPYFRCKVRANTAGSTTRMYVGLSYETNLTATDTPVANDEAAVLVGWRTSDSNITVFSNAGPNTTPTVTPSSVARSTSVRQYEIAFTSASNCRIRILDGNGASQLGSTINLTTNLPADSMSPSLIFSDSGTTARDFDIFFAELEQNV